MKPVNKNLRFIRNDLLGLKQSTLADKIGCSEKSIYSHESTLNFERSRHILDKYIEFYKTQPKVETELGLITVEKLLTEDLQETYKKRRKEQKTEDERFLRYKRYPVYSETEGIYILVKSDKHIPATLPEGLKQFLTKESRFKYNPDADEIAILKAIAFLEGLHDNFYEKALITLREFRDTLPPSLFD